MSLGRFKDALPIFERLSSAYPKEPRPRAGRVEAKLELELELNGEAAGRKFLDQALQQAGDDFGDSPEGTYLRARSRELAGEPGAALDHYASAIDLDPTHRSALFRGARLAERCGLDELARRWYQALARVLPVDRATLFNLGVLLEDAGRDAEAAACYETICKADPQDRRARLYLKDAREGIDMFYDEDMERKEDRLNQLLRTPVTDFELSVRARNCLAKMNIVTLGDLVRHTEQDLLSYKNFGETSLNEIKEILATKNLRLGMAHAEAVASMGALLRERAADENSEVLNKPIHELELSIRARRTVENLGCLTVSDVLQHSEEELLSMPNFGVTSLQELKRKLEDLGVKLPERKAK
jgi:DNA-directed RNA polymerase subunit alpha